MTQETLQDLSPLANSAKEMEIEEKPQKSLNEKQQVYCNCGSYLSMRESRLSQIACVLILNFSVQENQDLLIKCISRDLGFAGGRPIAACVIYKCLLHWRSFEVERTSVFDRIIQSIGSAIEVLHSYLIYKCNFLFKYRYIYIKVATWFS